MRFVKTLKLLCFPLLCLILRPAFANEGVLTLEEAFRRALIRSESVAIQEETIKIAEAHYLQALGNMLPHLDARATEFIQDIPSTTATSSGGSTVSNTFLRRSRPEVAITLTQPIFSGMREFKALKVATAEKMRNSLQYERAKQLLFSDVARAYYTVLEIERQRDIQTSIRGTLMKRIGELKDRIKIGKSRNSELLTTESQLAAVEADTEHTKGLMETSREYLAFLVGDAIIGDPGTQKLIDEFKTPGTLPPVQTYVAQLDSRPDLGASTQSVRLSQGQLDYQKGGRYPTIDFTGNYYPYRVGFQKDIHWDMTFNMNVPIFHGGLTRGLIREADAKLNQAKLGDSEARRQAETDVHQAYQSLKASKAQEAALLRAEAKAAASFKAQSEEYRLGLVNNLDVLQSLRDWDQQRLNTNLAYYTTKLDYLNVLVSSGTLPKPSEGNE